MKNVIWKMENEIRLSKLGLVRQRKGEQGVFARQAEFGADVRAVMFDGADADEERVGDLLVAFRFGDQKQDAAFRSRQVIDRRSLLREFIGAVTARKQVVGKRWAEEALTGGDRFDAADDLVRRAVFDHESSGASVERGVER